MVLCRSGSSDLVNVRYPFGLGLSRLGRSLTVRAEPVEAWASVLILRHACAEGGSRVVAPAGDSLFFASPKKSKQKKGDPQSATPSLRYGANLRRVGCGVRRGTRFAAAQRRLDNHGESVNEACALRRACSPRNRPDAGAASRGWTAEQPHGPSRCSAPSRRRKRHALRRLGRATRWPVWMSAPRVPFCACREARGRGCVRVPKDIRTSCTDSPQLFERSAQRAASSAVAPPARASQVARSAAKRRAQQGRLLFGDFLLARQEKVTAPPGAHPGIRHQPEHAFQTSTPQLRQAQPERTGDKQAPASTGPSPTGRTNQITIKIIATSA